MSLTRHLDSLESPVRRFIYGSAPQLALAGTRGLQGKAIASSFGFDELTALATQLPIPEEVKDRRSHASVAGIALDYRLRMELPGFDFEQTVAKRGLERLAADPSVIHRGKHIHNLLNDAFNLEYLTLQEKDPHPLSLARASVPLAWCESIARGGPIDALSGNLGKQIKRAKDSVALLMGIDEPLIFDIARMHRVVAPILEEWNLEIAAGGQYQPNPSFLGSPVVGGADADWVVGDMLVELKTREEITNPWIRDTLFQLLGYALLDLDDSMGIRRVGILLPRQPFLAFWSLDDLLDADAGEALPRLRADFAIVLNEMLDRQLERVKMAVAAGAIGPRPGLDATTNRAQKPTP
jgi:hypothetical protein